jgi:transposase InsO family protein
MAIFARGDQRPGLVHHSDRGVKYTAIRYTKRLGEASVVNSVDPKGVGNRILANGTASPNSNAECALPTDHYR